MIFWRRPGFKSICAIGSNVARDVVETLRKCTHGEGKDWFAFDRQHEWGFEKEMRRINEDDDVRLREGRERLKKIGIRTVQPSREIRTEMPPI
jgi:hypothetical protein